MENETSNLEREQRLNQEREQSERKLLGKELFPNTNPKALVYLSAGQTIRFRDGSWIKGVTEKRAMLAGNEHGTLGYWFITPRGLQNVLWALSKEKINLVERRYQLKPRLQKSIEKNKDVAAYVSSRQKI